MLPDHHILTTLIPILVHLILNPCSELPSNAWGQHLRWSSPGSLEML